MRRMHTGAAERLDAELAHLHLSARGSFYDARVVGGRARAEAAARGLEEASRGHGLVVCGLVVCSTRSGAQNKTSLVAGQEENAKCGLRRQFAKLSGHEAPHEEECYFRSSPNTTAIDNVVGSRLGNAG